MLNAYNIIRRAFDKTDRPESVSKKEWSAFCDLLEKVGTGISSLAGLGFLTQLAVHVGAIDWCLVVQNGVGGFYQWPEQARLLVVAFLLILIGTLLIICSRRLRNK